MADPPAADIMVETDTELPKEIDLKELKVEAGSGASGRSIRRPNKRTRRTNRTTTRVNQKRTEQPIKASQTKPIQSNQRTNRQSAAIEQQPLQAEVKKGVMATEKALEKIRGMAQVMDLAAEGMAEKELDLKIR